MSFRSAPIIALWIALADDLMAVAYGNNAFVAAGRNGLWSRHGD